MDVTIIFSIISVLGGLGLFLIGMKQMGEGLELAAGNKLRVMLQKITSNKFIAMLVGVLVTGVIQSSSATDAMVVGFVNAGLMDLNQCIGILFGSKIGTTVTSLILSFDIKAYVPLCTFAGAVIITFAKKNNYRYYGQILAGFGILFMGMSMMSANFGFLKNSEMFKDIVSSMSSPVLGLLVGMVFGLALCSFLQSGVGSLSGFFVLALGLVAAIWYLLGQKKGKDETLSMLRGLDWETIFFLAGIFVVVGGIENSGLLELLAGHMEALIGGNVLVGFILILLVSVLISGFVDNVPYIMVMLPVADQLARGLGLAPELYMFALLIGSCLGGNLTCYGASANVVAVGILKKHGVSCNFGNWLKIGIPFTLLTTAAAAVSLWLVWA